MRPRRSWQDDRGAMMIMGVFMATIVVAMLYYVAGIGETIVYRERMQDAADAAAFAGATIHARAMNLIALLNTIMAAVFAVVVAIRAAAFLYVTASGFAFSECSIRNPRPCFIGISLLLSGFAPTCREANDMKSRAEDIIEVCSDIQEGLARVAPIAAAAKGFEIGSSTYNPPTNLGFAIGRFLPIEPDDDRFHCMKMVPHAAPWAAVHARRNAPSGSSRYVNQAIVTMLLPWTAAAAAMDCDLLENNIKRVREDAQLGEEPFQIRGIMLGNPPFDDNEERVAVATWGEDASASAGYRLLTNADRFSFAQGEFYYAIDGGMDRREWLWNMRWRARLRRFWLPGADGFGASLCPAGLDCGTISRILGVGDVVVH